MSRILVIDDEAQARATVKAALRCSGAEVIEAENASKGFCLAHSERPDLVICDLHLGGKSGLELLAEMRQDPATATMPLILITGMDTSTAMRQSMDLGADDFLQKPFSHQDLLAAVNARLRRLDLVRTESERTNASLRRLLEATEDLVAIVEPGTLAVRYLNRVSGRTRTCNLLIRRQKSTRNPKENRGFSGHLKTTGVYRHRPA